MVRLSVAAAEVSVDEFVGRVERDLATERLTSAAIEAAAESSYSARLQAIADALAAGLSAEGRPEVDHQLLTIEALRDMEPVHVWMLDKIIQWEPLKNGILNSSKGPHGESASVGLRASTAWGATTPRTPWTREHLEANFARHQPAALFDAAYGTLNRHGLIAQEGVGRALRALTDRVERSDHRSQTLDDIDLAVAETAFGREVHTTLLKANAIEEVEVGELDLDSDLRGFRSLRPSAKLEKYARELRMPLSDARAFDKSRGAPEAHHGSGYHVVTQDDDELDY